MDKIRIVQNGGITGALFLSMFSSYVNYQQSRDEVREAQEATRIETNVMNSLTNQANEDVNLQSGINRLEEDFSDLEKDFNTFVTEYWKNRSLQ
jgi:predicted nuclease with TOPRIM domain